MDYLAVVAEFSGHGERGLNASAYRRALLLDFREKSVYAAYTRYTNGDGRPDLLVLLSDFNFSYWSWPAVRATRSSRRERWRVPRLGRKRSRT